MEDKSTNKDKKQDNASEKDAALVSPQAATPVLAKIAPKPTSVGNGQIVFIQSPTGGPQTIRIAGTTTAGTGTPVSNLSAGGFSILKTADGHYLHVKQKNTVANAVTNAIKGQVNTTPVRRIIVKGATGQQLIVQTSSSNPTASTTPSTTRTYTIAQAGQMGLLSADKLKEMVSAAITTQKKNQPQPILPASTSAIATNKTPAVTSPTTATTTPPTTTTTTKKILIQKTAGGKPVAISQNIMKFAQGGQIKAVNIPGKGIQYIHVAAPASSTTTATSTVPTATTSAATNQPSTSKFVLTTASPTPAASKLLVQNKVGQQTFTLLSTKNEKDTTAVKPTTTTANLSKPKQNTIQEVPLPKLVPVKLPVQPTFIKIEKEDDKPALVKESINLTEPSKSNVSKTEVKNEYTEPTVTTQTSEAAVTTVNSSLKRRSSRDDFINEIIKSSEVKTIFKSETDSHTATENSYDMPKEVIEAPRRKHCNCTKSQCLKLYCDCFANGEFCFNCNCKECFNNLENEDERLKAIKMCLDRNPHAFKPKIGKAKENNETLRRHTKGCNCKRSGCLKNYCECYEAKISCSGNCKCIGCRNVEDSYNGRPNYAESLMIQRPAAAGQPVKRSFDREESPSQIAKKPCNFMTQDVIEATIQCVIAQADECQQQDMDKETSERMILEEFGRCLVEIIEFSVSNNEN